MKRAREKEGARKRERDYLSTDEMKTAVVKAGASLGVVHRRLSADSSEDGCSQTGNVCGSGVSFLMEGQINCSIEGHRSSLSFSPVLSLFLSLVSSLLPSR